MGKQQPIAVSLDWLSFSVLLPLTEEEKAHGISLSCPPGYELQEYPGTNIYKRRFMLFTASGDKVLTLLCDPHSRIIANNSLFVEVANPILYYPHHDTLGLLGKIHEYSMQSLSRLDVCADFNPTLRQLSVIDGLTLGTIYAQGKREGAMFHDFHRPEGGRTQRLARQISWGGQQSALKWKLYNKTAEIFQVSPKGVRFCTKPYIPAMWRRNGINPDKDVWRLEWSLTGAGGYDWHGERLSYDTATAPHQYTALFWDIVANRFKLHLNEGHKQRRDDELVEFLPIPPPPHYRIRKSDPRAEAHHTDHAATLRSLMTQLERPEVMAYKALHRKLLDCTAETIRLARLQAYFFYCYGRPWEKWRREYEDANG